MSFPPRLFSKTMIGLILCLYFLASCFTAVAIVRRSYSSLDSPTTNNNNWILLGGLTATSIDFRIRRAPQDDLMYIMVATDDQFETIVWQQDLMITAVTATTPSTTATMEEEELVESLTATGLQANTRYYYATVDGGTRTSTRGTFQTAPPEGRRTPFQFVTSACSWSGSTHPVYTTILNDHPDTLFFAHLGDFHYENLNVDSVERRVQAVDRVLASDDSNSNSDNSSPQRALFGNRPLVYMWDDHDWLGNNKGGDLEEPGREAALRSYRLAMPYYAPLPSSTTSSSSGMYQAFTIGTVRFILTDLRSEATKTKMMSETQREWLYNELEQASTNYDFCIWFTTKPWVGEEDLESDSWWGYPSDRQALSEHIAKVFVNTTNLLVIGSDAHMIAFDDGSNTYYGRDEGEDSSGTDNKNKTKSFPLLQTGPLDRLASFKGGPFSEGCTGYLYERNHQYSVIDFIVDDETDNVCLEITTYRIKGRSTKEEIFAKRLCAPDDDMFVASNPGVGTCDTTYFSNTTTILISTSLALLLVVVVGLPCGGLCLDGGGVVPQVGGRWAAIGTSSMIFVLFTATFIVGSLIPVAQGIEQYNAFQTSLICLLQIGTVFVYLLAWRFMGTKKEEATTIEEAKDEVEREAGEAKDQDQEDEKQENDVDGK
jgi:hypothetical protein